MKVDEVKEYFVTVVNCARRIKSSASTFQTWRARGYIPLREQYIIEVVSKGELKARVEDDTRLAAELEEFKNNMKVY